MLIKKLVLFVAATQCFAPVANAASMELLRCVGKNARGDEILCLRNGQSDSQRYASLMDLYEEGWRLVGTQAHSVSVGNSSPVSPYVFFLERPKGDK